MILLNFARKLDPISLELFKQMTGTKIDEQITLPIEATTIDEFISGFEKAALKLKLTDSELCADRIAINPSGNQIQMQVLAVYLFKKTGKLPMFIVTRAPAFGLSVRLEIQEVVDLQKWIE